MRARFALLYSNSTVTLREIRLREKPAELLAISPKATVPVLHLPDGTVIEESLEIIDWALSRSDPDDWQERYDRELISETDGAFKIALDSYKYPGRRGPVDPIEARTAGLGFLTRLDQRLTTCAYLSGSRLGVTDIAIFPFVRQFAATDSLWFDAQPLPALRNWLAEIAGSTAFDAIMRRYPRWQPGDQPLPFPI